jgi:hypothetical protein
LADGREDEMKTILKISLFSLGAALIGFWPGGAGAQIGAPGRCGLASPGGILGLAPGGAAARAAMIKRTLKCLQATGQAPTKGSPGAGGQFVTFDPPGSTSTTPSGITPDGTITGYYSDTSGVQHGFLRDRNGSFTTFDPPGSTSTFVASISTNGAIAGTYCSTTACAPIHGFVRARDGTFTTFDSPAGSGGLEAPILNVGGPPPDINPAGAVAGTYFDSNFNNHGFLRDKNGAFTTIDVPGASLTNVLAINPSGTMVGYFNAQTEGGVGFIRSPNGSFTAIDIPGACGGQTTPSDINPAGVVVGTVQDASCSVLHAYVRFPDGATTVFDGPDATYTEPLAINPAGAITGYFCSNACHGFLRTPDGVITAFDPPGSFFTFPTEINAPGAIIGVYLDANGVEHGFLRLP